MCLFTYVHFFTHSAFVVSVEKQLKPGSSLEISYNPIDLGNINTDQYIWLLG